MEMKAVMKFGGGVLRDQKSFDRVADIVKSLSSRENVLVVSAVNGVTDLLLRACDESLEGEEKVIAAMERLRKAHSFDYSCPELDEKLVRLRRLLYGINYTGEVTPQVREVVSSFGERCCAVLLAEHLRRCGIDAQAVMADEAGIITDGRIGASRCLLKETRHNLKGLGHLLKAGKVVVLTGFFGRDECGKVTTFGRGGSDYSAGAIAAAMDADRLEIWKDVEGFMTADPKAVHGAQLLEEVSFQEAKELGLFGAKILHPRTLEPLSGTGVEIEIKSVLAPQAEGTKIRESIDLKKRGNRMAASIAIKRGIAVVNFEDAGLAEQTGGAATLFSKVAAENVSVDAISTTQVSISFTVDSKDAERAVAALKNGGNESIAVMRNMAMIGVVGDQLKHKTSDVAARTFARIAKEGVEAEMISQGASDISLSLVVPEKDVEKAVAAIHEELKKKG